MSFRETLRAKAIGTLIFHVALAGKLPTYRFSGERSLAWDSFEWDIMKDGHKAKLSRSVFRNTIPGTNRENAAFWVFLRYKVYNDFEINNQDWNIMLVFVPP